MLHCKIAILVAVFALGAASGEIWEFIQAIGS
jgi:hypothetical protein